MRDVNVIRLALSLVSSRNASVSANALALLANVLAQGNTWLMNSYQHNVDSQSRKLFLQVNGIGVILAALSVHKPLIQRNACAVLANIAVDGIFISQLMIQIICRSTWISSDECTSEIGQCCCIREWRSCIWCNGCSYEYECVGYVIFIMVDI